MRGETNSYSRRYDVSGPTGIIGILFVCLACWTVGYFYSIGYPVYGEVAAPPLWNAVCQLLPGKLATYLIGIVLVVGGAFLLHRANYALVLIREKTLLPFMFYILLISTNPDFFPLKATSVGVFCLVLAIYQLFISYHDPKSVSNSFNAALIIALGSLLWIHILWFLPLFWVGMYNFRSLSPKTFTASLIGVGTVYWFLLAWCMWTGDYTSFTIPFHTLFKFRFLMVNGVSVFDWLTILYVGMLTTLAAVNILTHEYDDVLRTRQFLSFLILFAVWSFGLYFLYEQASEEYLEMACISAAILISHFFTVKRTKITFWLFHFTWIFFVTLLFLRIWNSL
ncbi:MAG: hypothetical protein RRZ65_08460 [Tannerellaceae bacterium]